MRINITHIMKATNCNEEQALNVEQYINRGDMLDWSEASLRMINTISRAVYEKLRRDEPVKKAGKVKIVTSYSGKKTELYTPSAEERTTKPAKVANKAPQAGTKIAHAMVIYKSMLESGDAEHHTRQSIISALANSMQITKQQAAGYYQNCKKKLA